jgi:hypothetical protein
VQSQDTGSAQTITTDPVAAHAGRAFVVSLAGLVVLPLAVVGLILSVTAYERAKSAGASTGLAVAGIELGSIGGFALLFALYYVLGYVIGRFVL